MNCKIAILLFSILFLSFFTGCASTQQYTNSILEKNESSFVTVHLKRSNSLGGVFLVYVLEPYEGETYNSIVGVEVSQSNKRGFRVWTPFSLEYYGFLSEEYVFDKRSIRTLNMVKSEEYANAMCDSKKKKFLTLNEFNRPAYGGSWLRKESDLKSLNGTLCIDIHLNEEKNIVPIISPSEFNYVNELLGNNIDPININTKDGDYINFQKMNLIGGVGAHDVLVWKRPPGKIKFALGFIDIYHLKEFGDAKPGDHIYIDFSYQWTFEGIKLSINSISIKPN